MTSHNASAKQALAIAKTYHGRSSRKAFTAIATNYLVVATCVAVSQWAFGSFYITAYGSKSVYVLAIIIIASRMRAMENLVHEASHNNLFPHSHLHARLQFLYGFPVFRIWEDYRNSHMIHHKYLGDSRKDPDLLRLYQLGLHRLPEKPVWFLVGLPATGFLTYEYLTTTFWEFWFSSSCRRSKSAYWLAIAFAMWYTATLKQFVYYYMVPMLFILPTTRYWAEISEHLGLDLRNEFGSSRTNVGFFHQWYLNPHNDGYHAVHHLYSQVPFYLLPEAHRRLMDASDEYGTKSVISFGVLEAFHQMATNPTINKIVS